jgi:hypothetical protein
VRARLISRDPNAVACEMNVPTKTDVLIAKTGLNGKGAATTPHDRAPTTVAL